ncbi:hypothetical protein G7046_g7033 [Stylonectria norvegica]|nr:hypothetical protein G7046_g7033 [Stylonectria norvegica]
MLRRRSLWPRPCLHLIYTNTCPPSSNALRLHDPPITSRPAVGRRFLASLSTTFTSGSPPEPPLSLDQSQGEHLDKCNSTQPAALTPLDSLLRAIQRRNDIQIVPCFIHWVKSLVHESAEIRDPARAELQQLPAPTLSEILRWVDPVGNAHRDAAHGVPLALGHLKFIEVGHLNNVFGVRKQHADIFHAVKNLFEARREGNRKLLLQDYEMLIRCAGASSEVYAVMKCFGDIARDGLARDRNTATWNEFIKARYLTEPLYYQFDRSRVAVDPRNSITHRQSLPAPTVWAMEKMRFSISATRRLPFGRQRADPATDLSLSLRKKHGFFGFRQHFIRAKLYGVLINEEYLCASLIALARSGSIQNMKGIVLKRGFRIALHDNPRTGEISISSGKRFRPGNPREPTVRLLNAIVEAFGCLSRIETALKLLVYVSYRYEIPIPHETWSNLLSWAYVSASKRFAKTRKLLKGDWKLETVKPQHIVEIWRIMTSNPFNIQPSIVDLDVYVRALIVQRKFRLATQMVKERGVPHYRMLEAEHRQIITDEVLLANEEPSQRRLAIEAQKELVYYQITKWFNRILKVASSNKWQREDDFMTVVVPDLILEYGEFFHKLVRYRTAHGVVTIKRPMVWQRQSVIRAERKTLPQKMGLDVALSKARLQGIDLKDPDFEWPGTKRMVVKYRKRVSRFRRRAEGPPPQAGDSKAKSWWKRLADEISI